MSDRRSKLGRSRLLVALVGAAALASVGLTGSAYSHGTATPPPIQYAGLNQVVFPGVWTLAQLYKGTEALPPTSGPPVAKNKFVVWMSCGQAAPGCAGPPLEAKKAAAVLGWKYRIIDGNLNVNNGWLTGLRQAIALHPDAIVTHGANCPDILQGYREAKAANIPVLGVENIDCNDPAVKGAPLFTVGMKYTTKDPTSADYFYRWAAMQADYAIDATSGHANIIALRYLTIFGNHMWQAYQDEIKKCKTCKIVQVLPFTADQQTPNGVLVQRFRSALIKHPEANVTLALFDTQINTAGFDRAVVQAGRAKNMIVTCGEGYAPAQQDIRNQTGATACPAHDGHWMGWGAMDELNRFFNHQPTVGEGIGFRIVDAKHNLSPPGKDYSSPIDWRDAYIKLWKKG